MVLQVHFDQHVSMSNWQSNHHGQNEFALQSPLDEQDSSSDDGRGTIVEYYSEKTRSLLQKYGPGPGVHFHIGYFNDDIVAPPHTSTPTELRLILTESQRRTIAIAAEQWRAEHQFQGRLLDAGCGLGGGSIYWATHYPVEVTAVTIVPDHIPIIRQHAEEVGVGSRIHTVCSDVISFSPHDPSNVVVAMEAACYWNLFKWFRHLAEDTAPGAIVCIEDTMLGHDRAKEPFDSYWHTNIVSRDTYVSAAAEAGFQLIDDVDITDATTPFWDYSLAYNEAMLRVTDISEGERQRLTRSSIAHALMKELWNDHSIEVKLLLFKKN